MNGKAKAIIELKKNIYEFTTQLGKSFYELFAEFDDKKDKHGNFTQFQTKTTKKNIKNISGNSDPRILHANN
jgi:hypothetical protein